MKILGTKQTLGCRGSPEATLNGVARRPWSAEERGRGRPACVHVLGGGNSRVPLGGDDLVNWDREGCEGGSELSPARIRSCT